MKQALLTAAAVLSCTIATAQAGEAELRALIAQHAAANGVPEALVHRVIRRESNYNPRAVGRGGAMGLMQIKTATARSLGYAGGPSGLLDANTNLTYAVRYLGNAYRVAGGNHDRAVSYYANGYYYAAKRKGLTGLLATKAAPAPQVATAEVKEPETTSSVTKADYVIPSRLND